MGARSRVPPGMSTETESIVQAVRNFDETDLMLVGVLAGIVAVLDVVGMVTFPIMYGVSGLYIGVAFFTAFAVWFRWRGLASIYVGLLVGKVIVGQITIFAPVTNLANVIGALVPLFVFSLDRFDPRLESRSDVAALVVVAFLYSLFSGVYFFTTAYLVGLVPYETVFVGLSSWLVGDTLVIAVLGSLLLRTATPVVAQMSYASPHLR